MESKGVFFIQLILLLLRIILFLPLLKKYQNFLPSPIHVKDRHIIITFYLLLIMFPEEEMKDTFFLSWYKYVLTEYNS